VTNEVLRPVNRIERDLERDVSRTRLAAPGAAPSCQTAPADGTMAPFPGSRTRRWVANSELQITGPEGAGRWSSWQLALPESVSCPRGGHEFPVVGAWMQSQAQDPETRVVRDLTRALVAG